MHKPNAITMPASSSNAHCDKVGTATVVPVAGPVMTTYSILVVGLPLVDTVCWYVKPAAATVLGVEAAAPPVAGVDNDPPVSRVPETVSDPPTAIDVLAPAPAPMLAASP